MNEDLLRDKIYEQLGLNVGSLSSESGNDWERAKKEILEEEKRKEYKKNAEKKEINYLTLSKDDMEFQSTINSNSIFSQSSKEKISMRDDLTENEVIKLIEYGNKEVHINLAKHKKLSNEAIDLIIPKSVYLVKKYLIKKQNLNEEQKEKLMHLMEKNINLYSDLLNKKFDS